MIRPRANARCARLDQDLTPMSADIIVSYDGTPNDDDALALGEALAASGASLALAYVRHSREFDPSREQLAQHDAALRLEFGAQVLGEDVATHVVLSASTGGGLEQLALAEGASMIAFGSDYRTRRGARNPATQLRSCSRAARSRSRSRRQACARGWEIRSARSPSGPTARWQRRSRPRRRLPPSSTRSSSPTTVDRSI